MLSVGTHSWDLVSKSCLVSYLLGNTITSHSMSNWTSLLTSGLLSLMMITLIIISIGGFCNISCFVDSVMYQTRRMWDVWRGLDRWVMLVSEEK